MSLLLGRFGTAIECGLKAVDLSDRSGDSFQAISARAVLAHAYHQAGRLADAEELFLEADRRQGQHQPARPLLYSVLGYLYCDFFLDRGASDVVKDRASVTLQIAIDEGWALQSGLDHISLGRAEGMATEAALDHLNKAVRALRRSGQVDYMPSALLARAAAFRLTGKLIAAQRDLDEVYVIATRNDMRTFVVDYHLERAQLSAIESQWQQAHFHLLEARRLMEETGYRRREPDLERIRNTVTQLGASKGTC